MYQGIHQLTTFCLYSSQKLQYTFNVNRDIGLSIDFLKQKKQIMQIMQTLNLLLQLYRLQYALNRWTTYDLFNTKIN